MFELLALQVLLEILAAILFGVITVVLFVVLGRGTIMIVKFFASLFQGGAR